MKTAKEYADEFNKILAPFSDRDKMNEMVVTMSFNQMLAIPKGAVDDVLKGMLNEFLEQVYPRGLESGNELYAYWVEANTKWLNFINLVENKTFPVKKDNLRRALQATMPELEEAISLIEMTGPLLKGNKHKKGVKLIDVDLSKEALDEETKRTKLQ